MEQESEEWWLAVQKASLSCFSQIEELGNQAFNVSRIKAVAVTGQMQDIIPLRKVRWQSGQLPREQTFATFFCSQLLRGWQVLRTTVARLNYQCAWLLCQSTNTGPSLPKF